MADETRDARELATRIAKAAIGFDEPAGLMQLINLARLVVRLSERQDRAERTVNAVISAANQGHEILE